MAGTLSRAYKLKLSAEGIDLFLCCHGRLCHLAKDFLPYGMTLFVAMTLLERALPDELLDEVTSPQMKIYEGKQVRFVGTSLGLADVTFCVIDRLERSNMLAPLPQIWKLYIAALNYLRASEDADVVRTYDAIKQSLGQSRRRGNCSSSHPSPTAHG